MFQCSLYIGNYIRVLNHVLVAIFELLNIRVIGVVLLVGEETILGEKYDYVCEGHGSRNTCVQKDICMHLY